MTAEAQPVHRIPWGWRLWGRILGYVLAGAMVCGYVGACLGSMVGGWINIPYGAGGGGAIGLVCGSGVGALIYLVAAILSEPGQYWKTFRWSLPFTILGMNIGAIAGASASLLPLGLLALSSKAPSVDTLLNKYFLFFVGVPPVSMMIGQIIGISLKKRHREREIWLHRFLSQGAVAGLLTGGSAGLTAGIVAHSWEPARDFEWSGTVLGTAFVGSAGGLCAGILAAFGTGFLAVKLLPESSRNRLIMNLYVGLAVGLTLAMVATIFYVPRARPFGIFFGTMRGAEQVVAALWFCMITWLPGCLFVCGLLSIVPVLGRFYWMQRIGRAHRLPDYFAE